MSPVRKPARAARGRFEVVRVDSWDEFVRTIRSPRFSNWAFRGHADESWPLLSRLSRHFRAFGIHPRAWSAQEARILRIFRRKAHHFLSHVPEQHDHFQWLALMQHHGAPTRLLDLTWSPYVAAFFALERATTDAAVWAFNAPQISFARSISIAGGGTIRPSRLRIWDLDTFDRLFLRGSRPFVLIAEPYLMNSRLIAQSGTFAIPGTLAMPIEEILGSYQNSSDLLVKLILPHRKVREQAMQELYQMGITNATLFPDLDGLARSLAYELEYHWAYDPKTMKPRPGFRTLELQRDLLE